MATAKDHYSSGEEILQGVLAFTEDMTEGHTQDGEPAADGFDMAAHAAVMQAVAVAQTHALLAIATLLDDIRLTGEKTASNVVSLGRDRKTR